MAKPKLTMNPKKVRPTSTPDGELTDHGLAVARGALHQLARPSGHDVYGARGQRCKFIWNPMHRSRIGYEQVGYASQS